MPFQEELAKRLWGSGEIGAEAFAVLRLIVRYADRGEKLDDFLFEWAKVVLERYDLALMKGHEASNVVPLKRD